LAVSPIESAALNQGPLLSSGAPHTQKGKASRHFSRAVHREAGALGHAAGKNDLLPSKSLHHGKKADIKDSRLAQLPEDSE
jgi:hypothetical protein